MVVTLNDEDVHVHAPFSNTKLMKAFLKAINAEWKAYKSGFIKNPNVKPLPKKFPLLTPR